MSSVEEAAEVFFQHFYGSRALNARDDLLKELDLLVKSQSYLLGRLTKLSAQLIEAHALLEEAEKALAANELTPLLRLQIFSILNNSGPVNNNGPEVVSNMFGTPPSTP